MTDKRLLVHESEYGRVLSVAKRDGNILSAVVRDAFDKEHLRTLTRTAPLQADGAHISIIGHTTRTELLSQLDKSTEVANGFLNRHLLVAVRRSKLLPSGGQLDHRDVADLGRRIRNVLGEIRRFGRLHRTPEAETLWADLYRTMADDDGGSLADAATARAEALTLRLSLTYALLDRSRHIDVPHLEAAWALWRYCRDSARWLFGSLTGDPVADRIATALDDAGPYGMDGTELRDLFQRHESGERIRAALDKLAERGLVVITRERNPAGGRTRTIATAKRHVATCDISDVSDPTPVKSPGSLRSQPYPTLNLAARYGLAGELLNLLEPHTEADPAGLLTDFLASFGNAAGPNPHAVADGAKHPARLFVL